VWHRQITFIGKSKKDIKKGSIIKNIQVVFMKKKLSLVGGGEEKKLSNLFAESRLY